MIPDDVRRDEALAPRTTLGLGGAADFFVEVAADDVLVDRLRWARSSGLPVTLLGGGSNAIVPDEGVRGLVVRLVGDGHRIERVEGERVDVAVRAGVAWDDFVRWAVDEDFAGVECLAGIPGAVGATPIQNVGAYGQDVSETVREVRVIDPVSFERRVWSAEACAFAYRDSALKRAPLSERPIVTEVVFALRRRGAPARRYAELERAIPEGASLRETRDTVIALRRRKSMVLAPHGDPEDPNRRSAGSFFTNPIVPNELAGEVVARALREGIATEPSGVPRWPEGDERTKLAAGWLIERAGFARGERVGNVGLSTAHALALVHHGGGTTSELLAFAERVVRGVHATFGVTLEREPRLLGIDG
ncbi:MAG: UDP-N-acetylmuramate dehydrogenase [Sandaracinus sp.]|jgi:UDP-N-acetylmuramate dehydrogenase|nr:UDP-N-acetylmuramate dehydrogenase [Sandaracinus sp.]MCB9612614.1 UDP-N-acetylmuramate dehydrogenase [Sandaracinus sp.]MCB9620030.1 UDP-N-acetylmuramate dehydrogenase [Sandaracinus sp.]MCB9631855.1 UDP-N-acetylmuramate dehydrogenase [Sandaracinus sp.]